MNVVDAVIGRNLAEIQNLISRNQVNEPADHTSNLTGLMAAVVCCQALPDYWEILNLLLRSGADPNVANLVGITPLMLATVRHSFVFYRKNASGVRTLHGVRTPTVTKIYDFRFDIDIEPTTDPRRVHQIPIVDTVQALLEKGANPSAVDSLGISALMTAATSDSVEVVDILIKRGANVNAQSIQGVTALQLSAREARWDTLERLLESGANVNYATSTGVTPLIYACAAELHLPSIRRLLELGADPNARDEKGHTALTALCARSSWSDWSKAAQVASLLIRNGAGSTPSDLAFLERAGTSNWEAVRAITYLLSKAPIL